MDQFTRRVIGFAVQPGAVNGPALCRMFYQVIAAAPRLPGHLSSDGWRDPSQFDQLTLKSAACP